MLLDNIKINYTFRPYPRVNIDLLDDRYENELVLLNLHIIDEKTNQPVKISGQHYRIPFKIKEPMYSIYAKWYINVKVWNPKYGFVTIDTHTYNDCGKSVLMNFHTDNYDELYAWFLVAFKYKDIHKCKLHFSIADETLHKRVQQEFGIFPIEWDKRESFYTANKPYATYEIGRFNPHPSTKHFMYKMDEDMDKIPNLFSKEYPSGARLVTTNMMFAHKNPRDWANLTSEQVAEDILGLSQDWSLL